MAAYDRLTISILGCAIVSAGLNGLGKLMSSCVSVCSYLASSGEA